MDDKKTLTNKYHNALRNIFKEAGGFIFDLDGTVYLGDTLIEGADRFISQLRDKGFKVGFVSNKPIAQRSTYAKKLNRLGIACKDSEVINSSLVLARYLSTKHSGALVLPVAEQPVIDDLQEFGMRMTDAPEKAEVVVVSWDREFNYEKLHKAYRAAENGAFLVGTNPDATCPMPDGDLPDAACMIAAVEACTGRRVDPIVGKPSPIMLKEALGLLQLSAPECVMVGDRTETDIKMAEEAGLRSILVLSGVTKAEDLPHTSVCPDAVIENVEKLIKFLGS